jgi:hypothetical protein
MWSQVRYPARWTGLRNLGPLARSSRSGRPYIAGVAETGESHSHRRRLANRAGVGVRTAQRVVIPEPRASPWVPGRSGRCGLKGRDTAGMDEERRRHHVYERGVQRAFHDAARKEGIVKHATCATPCAIRSPSPPAGRLRHPDLGATSVVQARLRSYIRPLAYATFRMALTRIPFSTSLYLSCASRRR